MSDGVIITIEMSIKPEHGAEVRAAIPAMFEDTVTFKGFRSIRVVQHGEDANRLLIVEHWDERADYDAYHAWRDRDGAMAAAVAKLVSIKAETWPALIGFAARPEA